MKMVKSLLLGSAAGIVAVAGAQAADLPVKAKPVEYVKVCSIYGAGFYYIPGTDTCLKVGGFARADYAFNGSANGNPYTNGASGRFTREDTNYYNTRVRGIVSWDARSQTEWGTLRAYVRAGWELNSTDPSYRGTCYFDRAFIQFAGLTVGKTQSFFDFYANALNYNTSLTNGSDTGHGINLIAYTMQFAGGFSATVSLEENTHRRTGLWDASTNPLTINAIPGVAFPVLGNYAAQRYPDIVANLRVDQPWGSAQIAGALHDASASCFGVFCNPGGVNTSAADATGWAVMAGAMFNLPWAQGDQFWVQGTAMRGAASYIGFNTYTVTSIQQMYSNSGARPGTIGSVALNWGFDGIFTTGSNVNLTDGWQVNAAIQHYWTPSLRTSVFGGVESLEFDAAARGAFCFGVATGSPIAPVTAVAAGVAGGQAGSSAILGCNPDFRVWQVGTRTIWSPVRNLDIGVEILYTAVEQNHTGNWNLGANGSRAGGLYTAADQDTWTGLVRFQRNFNP